MSDVAPSPRPTSAILSYHAHVYYRDATERAAAARLREAIAARFLVRLGRWRDEPVGPHAHPMFQVAFGTELFAQLVPWLMLNRLGLPILVHPNTDNTRRDHLAHALWLGEIFPIMNPENLPEGHDPDLVFATEPNTKPDLPA